MMKCPYCKELAIFCDNRVIYGRSRGKSYMIWLCSDCDAYVGTHENDPDRPLGTMANRELRTWRREVHKIIDWFWKNGEMKRHHVYFRLSRYFGQSVHVGRSDLEMCKKIIKIADPVLTMSKEKFLLAYPEIGGNYDN